MNGDLRDYQKIFECIQTPICVAGLDGYVITCNKAMLNILCCQKEDVIGKHIHRLHPRGTERQVLTTLENLENADETVCHVPLLSSNGSIIPVISKLYKGTWEGTPVVFGFSQDLTEQVENEEKFRAIFSCSPLPMLISRVSDGVVLEANPAWLTLMGLRLQDILGKSTLDMGFFLDPKVREELRNKFLKQGSLNDEWVELGKPDGSLVYGRLSATPLQLSGIQYWVTCFVDRTKEYKKRQKYHAEKKQVLFNAMASIDAQFSNNKFIVNSE